jgi:hypothetical protein
MHIFGGLVLQMEIEESCKHVHGRHACAHWAKDVAGCESTRRSSGKDKRMRYICMWS